MRVPLLIPLLALGALPCVAVAQHGVLAGASGAGDCNVCHASHNQGMGAYTLRTGDGAAWLGRAGGDALGAPSQSCLRCHGVAQVRRRQPEFSRTGLLDGPEPTYLGFDFADDHPVGRAGQVRASTARVRDRSARTRLTPGGALEVERRGLECTRCHDPHSRRGATPRPDDEPALCGECHDLVGFRQGHQALPCSSCHQLHGGAQGQLLRSPDTDLVCRTCHDRAARSMPGGRALPAAYLAPQAHARDPRPPTGRCAECHTIHR